MDTIYDWVTRPGNLYINHPPIFYDGRTAYHDDPFVIPGQPSVSLFSRLQSITDFDVDRGLSFLPIAMLRGLYPDVWESRDMLSSVPDGRWGTAARSKGLRGQSDEPQHGLYRTPDMEGPADDGGDERSASEDESLSNAAMEDDTTARRSLRRREFCGVVDTHNTPVADVVETTDAPPIPIQDAPSMQDTPLMQDTLPARDAPLPIGPRDRTSNVDGPVDHRMSENRGKVINSPGNKALHGAQSHLPLQDASENLGIFVLFACYPHYADRIHPSQMSKSQSTPNLIGWTLAHLCRPHCRSLLLRSPQHPTHRLLLKAIVAPSLMTART